MGPKNSKTLTLAFPDGVMGAALAALPFLSGVLIPMAGLCGASWGEGKDTNKHQELYASINYY